MASGGSGWKIVTRISKWCWSPSRLHLWSYTFPATTLYSKWSGIWSVATTRIGFWTTSESGLRDTQLVLFDQSNNNTGAIDVKIDGSVLEETSSFIVLGLTFYSKLDWGSFIISIAKSSSKKIGALICSMMVLSPKVTLYLYKSTIWPCMEYYCHIWADAPSCLLELWYKIQKKICRTVGLSLATSLEH